MSKGMEPEFEALKLQVSQLNREIERLKEQKSRPSASVKGTPPAGIAMMARKSPMKKQAPRKSSATPPEYNKALGAYRAGNYDESILMFQNFSLNNPPKDLQDNAVYWIGSNYYQLEMYDDAIKQFEMVANKYPNGNKVHDSRYMLGMIYSKKGENSKAVEILTAALKKNPPADVRVKIIKQLKEIQ